MQIRKLGVIEYKALNALLKLTNNQMITTASNREIAETMGYKTCGGGLTFALKVLEIRGFINIKSKGVYHILL